MPADVPVSQIRRVRQLQMLPAIRPQLVFCGKLQAAEQGRPRHALCGKSMTEARWCQSSTAAIPLDRLRLTDFGGLVLLGLFANVGDRSIGGVGNLAGHQRARHR